MKIASTYIFFILGSFSFWGQSLQSSSPQLDKYSNDSLNFTLRQGTLSASPNPFTDYILIKGLKESYDLKVFDVLGKEIFNFTTTERNVGLSTNSYPTGVYIVELTPLKETDSEKIIFKMYKS